MLISTPISLGELIDKISILLIKEKNIQDKKKTCFIKRGTFIFKPNPW